MVGSSECLTLEVSGSDELIECQITAQSESFVGRIKMPAPLRITNFCFEVMGLNLSIQKVTLSGINHYIFPTASIIDFICCHENYRYLRGSLENSSVNDLDNCKKMIEIYATKALQQIKEFDDAAAFGLLFYDVQKQTIIPLIYVKSTDSLIWEKSCLSGTSAVAYLNLFNNNIREAIEYQQPGGRVVAEFTPEQALYLRATIKIVLEGKAYL